MNRNRIWISGADGKIGKVLQKYLDPLEDEVLATDKYIVDIVNSDETSIFARRNRPNVIINYFFRYIFEEKFANQWICKFEKCSIRSFPKL